MKEKIINVVLRRYPNININYEQASILYDSMLKESIYNSECDMNEYYYYYFEFAKVIEKYMIDLIKNGDVDIEISFVFDNTYLINIFLNHYKLYNADNILQGEKILFNTIEEYSSNELYSVQAIKNMKKEFVKTYKRNK